MPAPTLADRRLRVAERTRRLRQAIADLDIVAAGTLHIRTKTCGRANCRCAKDPSARHGPYYEWSRLIDGRLVHTTLSKEQGELLQRAIENRHTVEALMTEWEAETAVEVLDAKNRG